MTGSCVLHGFQFNLLHDGGEDVKEEQVNFEGLSYYSI